MKNSHPFFTKQPGSIYFVFMLGLLLSFILSCNNQHENTKKPADYVNPFIGTGGHGHTYPGAVVPFGMVQLSPDTKIDDWDHCSGYHYADQVILGFSHTHLSGTGIGDYGDIRFMPNVGNIQTNPGNGNNPDNGYASRFSHEKENAGAGYYVVHLDDYNIDVELTATERVGVQRYIFPKSNQAHIILDLKEAVTTEKILDSEIKIIGDHEIAGLRRTDGWANNQYVYFYTSFSKPFRDFGIVKEGEYTEGLRNAKGNNLKAWFNFDTDDDEAIVVKTAISPVDIAGAHENLITECPDYNFDSIRKAAYYKWNRELSKVEVSSQSKNDKTIFYTALYHAMLAPNIYSDVTHQFRGHDKKIHRNDTFTMYTVFSLWDTFRALHPLFTIIQRERSNDLINSMMEMYRADSLLPVWELASNETNCMIGYHSVPVIVDAYVKGIRDYDAHQALKAMVTTADANQFGLKYYKSKGYIPSDKEGESVSKTLEYAYDDWCIARMAQLLGEKDIQSRFIKRAQYYKNIFDKKSGFFRAKANGSFTEPFDPKQVNFNLTEANTWQYNFFVPQDINTLVDMLGGDEGFYSKLNELFNTDSRLSGRAQSDITGLIGQYAHGNEPSHNMAYLYNFVGKPWKTQQMVHQITRQLYKNTPDGLAGNEDCGQMSAWYVLSAMGFYPVTPGTDEYEIGTPVFDSAKINLENGNTFIVMAKNRTPDNFYIQSATLNGKPYNRSYITQNIILDGGRLEFVMGSEPNKLWAILENERPHRKITDHLITPVPVFKTPSKVFSDKMEVALSDLDSTAKLFLSQDNGNRINYTHPVIIDATTSFKAYAEKNDTKSFVEESSFFKIAKNRKVTLKTNYSKQYTAGGDNALINTLRGGSDFRTGNWQGYYGTDLDALIDLGEVQQVNQMGIGFLQDENSWIFMPLKVTFEVSTDGKIFQHAGTVVNRVDEHKKGGITKDFVLTHVDKKIRYIHVVAKNRAICPKWHKGYPNPSWIFTDEFWVK